MSVPCSRIPSASAVEASVGRYQDAGVAMPKLELGLACEPIVDLSSPDQDGPYGECLAHLLVSDVFLLKGGEFVGAFEKEGCIGLLDEAVVSHVLDILERHADLRLGCNISPYTLADACAWSRIVDRIAERSWLALRLTLEITESAPLDEIDDVAGRLARVQAYGCRIALDDFGAGYATPQHLLNAGINWDIVKIDRSFLGDLRKSPAGRDGLASMVSLAGTLAPLVIVEGIETSAHLALARASGARFGQGYLFEGQAAGQWPLSEAIAGSGEGDVGNAQDTRWHRFEAGASVALGQALMSAESLRCLVQPTQSPESAAGLPKKVGQASPSILARIRSGGRYLRSLFVLACRRKPLNQARWDM